MGEGDLIKLRLLSEAMQKGLASEQYSPEGTPGNANGRRQDAGDRLWLHLGHTPPLGFPKCSFSQGKKYIKLEHIHGEPCLSSQLPSGRRGLGCGRTCALSLASEIPGLAP
jgi:hypothetical protein